MSDDVKHPETDLADDDFEAHGLKEGLAVALGAGALAVAGTAQAYVPAPPGSDGRTAKTAPAKPLAKQTAKKKAAKKKAAKRAGVSGGLTSPQKAPLQPGD